MYAAKHLKQKQKNEKKRKRLFQTVERSLNELQPMKDKVAITINRHPWQKCGAESNLSEKNPMSVILSFIVFYCITILGLNVYESLCHWTYTCWELNNYISCSCTRTWNCICCSLMQSRGKELAKKKLKLVKTCSLGSCIISYVNLFLFYI